MIQTKLMPWYVANSVRMAFAPIIVALDVQSVFWATWHHVWRGSR